MSDASKFIGFVVVLGLVAAPIALALLKAGKAPPQTIQYLVSLLVRRIMMPLVDVAFDWAAVAAYWKDGKRDEAGAILGILLLGTLALSLTSAFSAMGHHEFEHLKTIKDQKHLGIGAGCLAGVFQVGPLFLGAKAVQAWREVTDSRWRLFAESTTTQAALEDFVCYVAEVKHFVHFEALFEGGPQLVLQSYLVISEWDSIKEKLDDLEVSAWVKLISPLVAAGGLIFAQLDFLCENDRFAHRVWQRDHPLVMLAALADLGGQLLMRAMPVVALLDGDESDGYELFGHVSASVWICLGAAWAFGVTWWAAKDPHSSFDRCDLATNAFLNCPHNLFFATTYYPGRDKETHALGAYQTTERALLSPHGLRLAAMHVVFTGCICAFAFVGARQKTFCYATAGAGCALMLGARAALFAMRRRRPEWFAMEATPMLTSSLPKPAGGGSSVLRRLWPGRHGKRPATATSAQAALERSRADYNVGADRRHDVLLEAAIDVGVGGHGAPPPPPPPPMPPAHPPGAEGVSERSGMVQLDVKTSSVADASPADFDPFALAIQASGRGSTSSTGGGGGGPAGRPSQVAVQLSSTLGSTVSSAGDSADSSPHTTQRSSCSAETPPSVAATNPTAAQSRRQSARPRASTTEGATRRTSQVDRAAAAERAKRRAAALRRNSCNATGQPRSTM